MRNLWAPHWLIGGALSLGGALAFRFAAHWLTGTSLIAGKIAGLIVLSVGLFIVMYGVNRAAEKREPLNEQEALRRVPGFARRSPKDSP